MMDQIYQLKSEIWLYPGDKGAWHFISVPAEIAAEIDFVFAEQKRGWGSLPVTVTIGTTTWQTSIFPDRKSNTYLLPLKADVRRRENLAAGAEVKFKLEIKT